MSTTVVARKDSLDHVLREHTVEAYKSLCRQKLRAAQLQSELDALRRHVAVSSSAEQDAVANLAQAECTQLCSRIMTQLPRELRDMVFQHLSGRSIKRISREYFRSTLDPETKMHTYDTARWRATHYPEHFWSPDYVGEDFHKEMIENYLRTSSFIFGDDDGLIDRFLESDQFKVGIGPKELVSKIEIHLNAMTFDRSSCIGYFFGSPTKPERLQAALQGLLGLKAGAKVCVYFTTQAKDEEQKVCQIEAARCALVHKLQEAKAAGLAVRLVVDKEKEVNLDDACEDGRIAQR